MFCLTIHGPRKRSLTPKCVLTPYVIGRELQERLFHCSPKQRSCKLTGRSKVLVFLLTLYFPLWLHGDLIQWVKLLKPFQPSWRPTNPIDGFWNTMVEQQDDCCCLKWLCLPEVLTCTTRLIPLASPSATVPLVRHLYGRCHWFFIIRRQCHHPPYSWQFFQNGQNALPKLPSANETANILHSRSVRKTWCQSSSLWPIQEGFFCSIMSAKTQPDLRIVPIRKNESGLETDLPCLSTQNPCT